MTDQFLPVSGTTVVVNGLLPGKLEPSSASMYMYMAPRHVA